jgi:MYXO-CTERM domain-containing protein
MIALRALFVILSMLPAAVAAQDEGPDPCAGIDCSGAGSCFPERGRAHCLCEEGFAAVGPTCVPAEMDGPTAGRRDSAAGQRAVDIAVEENGRGPAFVGAGLEEEPHGLGRYLEPHEWWCGDFVAWTYRAAGIPLTGGYQGGWHVANNLAIVAWFEQRGLWVARGTPAFESYVPRPGDFMRMNTDRGGHAAIVRALDGDTLYTVEGNVSGRVRLGRYRAYKDDPRIDGFGLATLPNGPPLVSAGRDTAGVLPRTTPLRGAIEDEEPIAELAVAWRRVSGPGEVAFSDGSSPASAATFSRPGRYVLALGVSDGEFSVEDEVAVDVFENEPPSVAVEAGPPAEDGRVRLTARVEDDGFPDGSLSLGWTLVDGPGDAILDDPTAADTAARFTVPGAYLLRVTATDGDLESSADVELHTGAALGCAAAGTDGAAAPILGLVVIGLLIRRRRG